MITPILSTVLIIVAWYCCDYKRKQYHVAEIETIRKQRNAAERLYDQSSQDYQRVVGELTKLRKMIGCPPGVDFLPEKSYWEDHCDLLDRCEDFRRRYEGEHDKLVSIYNYLCDANSGPRIGQLSPSTACDHLFCSKDK